MIRLGTKDDRSNLLDLGFLMHQESTYSPLSWSRVKAGTELDWTLRNGLVLVYETDGAPRGMMLGHVKAPWFSDDLVGYEEVLYIHPEYRTARRAGQMIDYWASWCHQNGAKMLRPSTSCGTFTADRLYEHLGYTLVGGNFVK